MNKFGNIAKNITPCIICSCPATIVKNGIATCGKHIKAASEASPMTKMAIDLAEDVEDKE